MMGYGNGMGAGGWVVMVVMMVTFWSLVVLAGVMIFRSSSSSSSSSGRGSDGTRGRGALEILAERFARGEIDSDEYETRRQVLRDSARDRPR